MHMCFYVGIYTCIHIHRCNYGNVMWVWVCWLICQYVCIYAYMHVYMSRPVCVYEYECSFMSFRTRI